MITKLFIVFGGILMCLLSGSAAAEVNILPNAGFEGGVDKDGIPVSWYTYVPFGEATIRRDDKYVFDGQYSALVETKEDLVATLASRPVPAAPGEKITLKVWCRVENLSAYAGNTLGFCAGFKDEQGMHFAWHKTTFPRPKEGEWFQLSLDATVPTGGAGIVLQTGLSRVTGKSWWDNAEIHTQSLVAARFEREAADLHPGRNTLPLLVLNRDPELAGKEIIATTEPGGATSTFKLTKELTQSIRVPVVFPERGKVTCKVTLSDKDSGAEMFLAKCDVTVKPLLVVEPVLPTHSCIEDGKPKIEGRVWVNESEDARKELSLRCVLEGPNGNLAEWKQDNLAPNPITYEMSPGKCPLGDYTVKVYLEREGETIQEATQDWHVINRSQSEVKLGDDGYLIVDGERFFPIGIFNSSVSPEMVEAGFNVTHAYNAVAVKKGERPDIQRAKDFLDQTQAFGMKMLMLVTHGLYTEEPNEEIKRRILTLKNHPALLAWDQEEGVARGYVSVKMTENLYAFLHSEAPEHPFMLGDCRDAVGRIPDRSDFFPLDYMDMGMWWWYPFPIKAKQDLNALQGEEASEGLEIMPPTFLTLAKTDKPIWAGIQAYCKPKEGDRYPTPEEYRAQAYLAVILGAKGLMYYGGYVTGGVYRDKEAGHWEYLKTLVSELRGMAPVFMSPDAEKKVTVSPENSMVEVRLKDTDSGLVLLAANRGDAPTNVVFNIPQIEKGIVSVRFEGRRLSAQGGQFSDEFAPYGAHVYEFR